MCLSDNSSSSSSSWDPSGEDLNVPSTPPSKNAPTLTNDFGTNSVGQSSQLPSTSAINEHPLSDEFVPSICPSSSQKSRKPYTSDKRVSRPPKGPSRKTNWFNELSTLTAPKLKRYSCCKKLRCFLHVNFDFFMENARIILAASTSKRRTILQSLLGSDNQFRFDGRVICVLFLKLGFHFSTVLISEVSSGKIKHPLTSIHSSSPSFSSDDNMSQSVSIQCQSEYSPDSPLTTRTKKKEAIIAFVQRISEDCGDSMPHRPEIHLPFYQHKELYPVFEAEFRKLYPTMQPVSIRYFRQVWRTLCPNVKVMKASRFTSCDRCDELKTALRRSIIAGECTDGIKRQRKEHLDFVSLERMEYQKKRDRARLFSGEY